MSVIVEFVGGEDVFPLGQVVQNTPDTTVELERLVPAGESRVPFVWVRTERREAFERRVRDCEYVSELTAVDHLSDRILYGIRWHGDPHRLVYHVREHGGVILDATANHAWHIRLRFPDHSAVSRFYADCSADGIVLHVQRTYSLSENDGDARRFGLTPEQREALVLGLRNGYFDTPSRTCLDDLADELGISQQAVSNRIRRGTKQVLRDALLSSDVA
jgi:predicted DNA binding protein